MKLSKIEQATRLVGGPNEAAALCGVSRTAFNRWRVRGWFPRSEFTGETQYAINLCAETLGLIDPQEIIEESRAVISAKRR